MNAQDTKGVSSVEDAPLRQGAGRRVDPFLAMDVLSAANSRQAAGHTTYHLEVGQPGAPVPDTVRQAAEARLRAGPVGYTDAPGDLALRVRIARHYAERYGLDVDPARILVTTGSSAGFSVAFLLVCKPGDRVALPRPGYPAYRNIVRALGLEPVEIDLDPTRGWQLDPRHLLAEHERAPIKALLIASPNNPTGTVVPPAELEALIEACRRAGIWFLSDEIYHGLVFEGRETCALAYDDDAIILNSFSKYYCMTGWRIGWMVLPQRLVRDAEALAQNLFICPPTLSQAAAEHAFDATGDYEQIKSDYAQSRQTLLALRDRLGLAGGPPADGAFYLYWPIHTLLRPGETSAPFCQTLLAETGIAITPGNDFDPVHGDKWVRVSFAGPPAMIAEAVGVFEAWAQTRLDAAQSA
ncbi:MAG: aminotransferase class I/II-fold pyridoxal phosphate-dependent enzyme [Devosiaceae bacterium]|nr:aminotransferase class I/II-fold pyridoxal phosphate-dependent enzyme [Devosiaceae bacterium MH13]